MTIVLTARPEWYDQAACRDLGPNVFYTDGCGQGSMGQHRVNRAKQICADCPVRDTCLADNLDEPFGIWGGLTPLERRTVRNARRLPPLWPEGQWKR